MKSSVFVPEVLREVMPEVVREVVRECTVANILQRFEFWRA